VNILTTKQIDIMISNFDEKNNTLLINSITNLWHYQSDAKDIGFEAKDEFHTTVLGYKAGEIIGKSLRNTVLKDLFLKAVAEYQTAMNDFYVHSLLPKYPEMRIIEKHYDKGTRKSLIIMLSPDEHRTKFYHKMEALFPDVKDHLPIPHITIGVDGDHPGIGFTPYVRDNELSSNFKVASQADLERSEKALELAHQSIRKMQDEINEYEQAMQNSSCPYCHQCQHCDQWGECTGGCRD